MEKCSKMQKLLLKVTAFLLLTPLAACVAPKTHYPDISQEALQRETERQQEYVRRHSAKKQAKKAMSNYQVKSRFARVTKKVKAGGAKLCSLLQRPAQSCHFGFKLSDREGVNAFADGRDIHITYDMIRFTDSDTELAVVVSHEYAHNLMQHVASQKKNVLVGSLIGIALDQLASSQGVGAGSTFSRMGTQAGMLRYSKDFEKEADYVGLYVMALSGYNITKSPEFWRKMSLENAKAIYTETTHPTNPARYIGLEKTVQEINEKKRQNQSLVPNIRVK